MTSQLAALLGIADADAVTNATFDAEDGQLVATIWTRGEDGLIVVSRRRYEVREAAGG